jgi:membrane peptidoglycan carboxypeptidase
MVKSIVAIEDYRFYQHGALDLKGTLRALVTNQANSERLCRVAPRSPSRWSS